MDAELSDLLTQAPDTELHSYDSVTNKHKKGTKRASTRFKEKRLENICFRCVAGLAGEGGRPGWRQAGAGVEVLFATREGYTPLLRIQNAPAPSKRRRLETGKPKEGDDVNENGDNYEDYELDELDEDGEADSNRGISNEAEKKRLTYFYVAKCSCNNFIFNQFTLDKFLLLY
jgi:hypothetical protein